MVDAPRIETMRLRLGKASGLVDDDKYLPMYRNRQIHYKELFDFSVKLAKKKNNPSRYFAVMWGKANLKKTLEWLQKLINLAKSAKARLSHDSKQKKDDTINQVKLDMLHKMKAHHGLLSRF